MYWQLSSVAWARRTKRLRNGSTIRRRTCRATPTARRISKAPAPRAADGKPDLSGMWFSAEVLPECVNQKDCIPQMNLPSTKQHRAHAERWTAVHAVGREARCGAHGERREGRSARVLSAAEFSASVLTAAVHQDRADAEAHDRVARVQRELSADLHRRPAAAEGSAAGVERLLDRPIGKATRSSSSRAVSATTCGSISPAAR